MIFIKGDGGAWLISGSANLTIAAWRDNRESVIVRPITHREHANAILSFFSNLDAKTGDLAAWTQSLRPGKSDWQFFHSFQPGNIFEHLSPANTLSIWSPYFSGNLTGFMNRLTTYGFKTINIIPDMTPHGKVRIVNGELTSIAAQNHISFKITKQADLEIFDHAKVWLSDERIAVGSWNCTYKGTRLNVGLFNIEAGIIAEVRETERDMLLSALENIPYSQLAPSTPEELEREWEQILENFSYCYRIGVDWQTFTYIFEGQDTRPNYTVALPDAPAKPVPLTSVHGRSFNEGFEKVLASKTFQVFDEAKQEVFRGYLEEKNAGARPVMGYLNVGDLIDSLLRDPSGSTGSSKVVYELDEEGTEGGPTAALLEYRGAQSYYRLFVAFQLLSDRLSELQAKPDELDRLLFRLPGSLLQIRLLITRMTPGCEDKKLFHWFIAQEFNRCLLQIKNQLPSVQLDTIETPDLLKDLKPTRKDKAFLKLLSKQFAYEL